MAPCGGDSHPADKTSSRTHDCFASLAMTERARASNGLWPGRRHLTGQRELKDGAPPRVGARPQTAAMRLDDPPTDGKSHPRALRFCGEECVEDALGLIDGKPDAGITHRNQELTLLDPLRCDGKVTACLSHRLDAVEHQVHQNLLQLNAIRCRPRKPRVEFPAD